METLAYGYRLVEGPRADLDGNVYFSDAVGGGVYRRGADGTIATVIPKRRGIGGLVPHADGGLVVSGRDVVHVRNGESRVLLTVPGVLGFNDLTTDAEGRVLVGSLRTSSFEAGPRVPGELWRIGRDGQSEELYRDVAFANGVGLSPDGRVVYQSNYSEGEILAHDLDADGHAGNRRVFARVPRGNPDGLAVDETGGVWVALGSGGGIGRFAPDGALRDVVTIPATFVASLCFGGRDRRDLYVATMDNGEDVARGGTLFRTRVDVPGLIAPLARV